jgi:hypothetical protein
LFVAAANTLLPPLLPLPLLLLLLLLLLLSCKRSNQGSIKSALAGAAAKKVKQRIDDIQKKVRTCDNSLRAARSCCSVLVC